MPKGFPFTSLEFEDLHNEVRNSPNPFHGRVEALLEWHELDPVDDWERRRNDIIYDHQENRNPFIDNPELADRIWSDGSDL